MRIILLFLLLATLCHGRPIRKGPQSFIVWATVMTSSTGGYKLAGGKKNNANHESFVALPSKDVLGKTVWVKSLDTGKIMRNIPVKDVGPWSIGDEYWEENRRPMAEDKKSDKYKHVRNKAGIDLSLYLSKQLGLKYPYLGQVEWYFEENN